VVKENIPSRAVVAFAKFLKKQKVSPEGLHILDLGSGIGRNSFYFAERGAQVTGLEISKTAIDIAKENMSKVAFDIKYIKQSIGEKFPLTDESCDIVLDNISSNSLSEKERKVYLSETHRVLKRGGYFFVRALCKEGDANAKALLKQSAGKERDTYVMPDLGLTERVFSREDFIATYQKYFKIIHLEKTTHYTLFNSRRYKRNYWVAYLQK